MIFGATGRCYIPPYPFALHECLMISFVKTHLGLFHELASIHNLCFFISGWMCGFVGGSVGGWARLWLGGCVGGSVRGGVEGGEGSAGPIENK